MMYEAVKRDDPKILHKVIEQKGDIYDFYGNGAFFTRAIAQRAEKLLKAYSELPHFRENILKYRPSNFYYAISECGLGEIRFLASLQLPRTTLCLHTLLKDSKFANSDKFMLHSAILAFMMSPDYHKELKHAGLNKNLLLSSLTTNDYQCFEYVYENLTLMGEEVSYRVRKQMIKTLCDSNSSINLAQAYSCLERLITHGDWFENCSDTEFKDTLRTIYREPIDIFDPEKSKRDYFLNLLVTSHSNSSLSRKVLPFLYGEMLMRGHYHYLEKHKKVFEGMEGQLLNVDMPHIQNVLLKGKAHPLLQEEAKRISGAVLDRILTDSGIEALDIRVTIEKSGNKRKVIKQAIILKAICEIGMAEAVACIKHVSYINAIIELGIEPYEMLSFTKNDKISAVLAEKIMDL